MKNVILTAVLALTAGTAAAATSGTTVTSGNASMGTVPAISYISATVTNVTAPVYIGLPIATTTKTLLSHACVVRDTNFNVVPRNIQVSNTTDILIASSGQASGTLAVGDRVNCVLYYQR